jgi:hypothetical protein
MEGSFGALVQLAALVIGAGVTISGAPAIRYRTILGTALVHAGTLILLLSLLDVPLVAYYFVFVWAAMAAVQLRLASGILRSPVLWEGPRFSDDVVTLLLAVQAVLELAPLTLWGIPDVALSMNLLMGASACGAVCLCLGLFPYLRETNEGRVRGVLPAVLLPVILLCRPVRSLLGSLVLTLALEAGSLGGVGIVLQSFALIVGTFLLWQLCLRLLLGLLVQHVEGPCEGSCATIVTLVGLAVVCLASVEVGDALLAGLVVVAALGWRRAACKDRRTRCLLVLGMVATVVAVALWGCLLADQSGWVALGPLLGIDGRAYWDGAGEPDDATGFLVTILTVACTIVACVGANHLRGTTTNPAFGALTFALGVEGMVVIAGIIVPGWPVSAFVPPFVDGSEFALAGWLFLHLACVAAAIACGLCERSDGLAVVYEVDDE